MAKAVILSKDRPAQLHLCLESIERNGYNFFGYDTFVLYTSSNNIFEQGYQTVKSYYPDVHFVKQESYYDDVMKLLSCSYLMSFFTDDNIIYKHINLDIEELEEYFANMPELCCFSLRLGLNTVVQDQYNNIQTVPPSSGFQQYKNLIYWNWRDCLPYMNFGYPLSVDGHIFRTDDMYNILRNIKFNNPNQQEGAMQTQLPMLPAMEMAFETSVVVNTPLNRVQDTCMNRAGEVFGQTAQDMVMRYLSGYKLDFHSIDFSNIIGCHQELDIKWTTR